MGKHEEIWAELRDLDDRVTRLEERLTAERDEALDKLDAMTAERDALRARIDAGVPVWGRKGEQYWHTFKDDADTHTALLIDARPIAEADERKGERRKGLEILLAGRFKRTEHSAYYQGDQRHPKDRRRTAGTIADRGKAS